MLCITGQPGPEGLDEDLHRRSAAKGWYSKGQSETAFSDAFPFLVTSQVRLAPAILAALSSCLAGVIPTSFQHERHRVQQKA